MCREFPRRGFLQVMHRECTRASASVDRIRSLASYTIRLMDDGQRLFLLAFGTLPIRNTLSHNVSTNLIRNRHNFRTLSDETGGPLHSASMGSSCPCLTFPDVSNNSSKHWGGGVLATLSLNYNATFFLSRCPRFPSLYARI